MCWFGVFFQNNFCRRFFVRSCILIHIILHLKFINIYAKHVLVMWKCVGTILWECFDYTSLKNVVTHNSCNTTSILGCFAVAVVVAIVAFIRSFYRIEFLRRSCMRMSVLYFNFYLKAISRFIAGWHKFSQYAYEVNLQFIRKIYLFYTFLSCFLSVVFWIYFIR